MAPSNVLDVQLPVDEIDLWVNVKGLLDGERCVVHCRHCCSWVGGGSFTNTVKVL